MDAPTSSSPFVPPPRILLGPGPSSVDPRVLKAMSHSVLGHLDPSFLALMDQIRLMLRRLFRTENEATLAISGSGTSAMEAAIVNLVEPGDRVLVCVAGYFGGRMADMIRRAQGEAVLVETEWGRPVDPEQVERALRESSGQFKAVAMVHAETSTGVLQPLDDIVRLAHSAGALALVDAVASLGGVDLDVDSTGDDGIDVCYSGAQKCLGAPPGASPITVNARALRAIRERRTPVSSFSLDLALLEGYWGAARTYHHTAPINTLYALHEALRLALEEGIEARVARHLGAHRQLVLGVEGLGLEFLVEPRHRLPVLNALRVPAGQDDRAVRSRLLSEHGIEIGGGLGPLAGRLWRVGLMGYSAREENVARFLTAMRIILGAPRMSRPRRPA